ncbi:hypothetical protein O181_060351 [Austropuccinia psidii MF-1]|uniref:Uncharacterized protein n=1 Tax=Austropuccinia psidii MF-1 TaxID=1389203 RepID=A0A9Q3EE06_9BASI|nr:hypothetical protein [Austropuccinia psidii MF-1]
MYCMYICNGKNRYLNMGKYKDKKVSFDINNFKNDNIPEELLEELKEDQYGTQITSKENLSLLKISRKRREDYTIKDEGIGKIKEHDIELYLDVERPYPPILRRPP